MLHFKILPESEFPRTLNADAESRQSAIYGLFLNEIGKIFIENGDYKNAVDIYKKFDFFEDIYANNAAFTYEKTGDYKKATKLYKRALQLNPNNKNAAEGMERVAQLKADKKKKK